MSRRTCESSCQSSHRVFDLPIWFTRIRGFAAIGVAAAALVVTRNAAGLQNAALACPRPDDVRYLLLISLDGFAQFYLDDARAHLPTLRRMIREGAVAEGGMECSFPTVTWPNHTTLVTGVPPARHGVLGNAVFDREKAERVQLLLDPLFDKDELVKQPTIYDVAHAAGLKTAAIVWPATRNAKTLDWTVPDMATQEAFEKYGTAGWLEELEDEGIPMNLYGSWVKLTDGGARRDWMATRAAASLIQRYRPNLLLLHLIDLDHTEHENGPKGGDALWAASMLDNRVRDLLDTLNESGLSDNTTVIVTSDHGFFTTDQAIHVNVQLREMGLVRLEEDKVGSRDAWSVTQGGAAAVYIVDRKRREEIAAQIKQAMANVDGVEAIIEPKDFAEIGQATPDEDPFAPDLWLAARDGYRFTNDVTGDSVVAPLKHSGTHGYLPTHADMHGIFIAWGRGIKPGTRLGTVKNTQVAPTIARLLGLELPSAEGKPLVNMLSEPAR